MTQFYNAERRTDKHTQNKPACDRDCFRCPYPDCILDDADISLWEWAESTARDKRLQAAERSDREKKVAACKAAYYQANKEKKEKAPPGLTRRAGQRNNKNPNKILCSCADYSTGERKKQ